MREKIFPLERERRVRLNELKKRKKNIIILNSNIENRISKVKIAKSWSQKIRFE